jgi:hypothetical protein
VQDSFFSLTFQSSLNIGALLLGVFGFLYSLYGTLMNQESPPPIVETLRRLFKFIAVLMSINFLIFLYSLYLILPAGSTASLPHMILASGLVVFGCATVLISLWLAFKRDR